MTTSEAQVPAQEEPTILEKQETPERPFEFDLDELVASAKKVRKRNSKKIDSYMTRILKKPVIGKPMGKN